MPTASRARLHGALTVISVTAQLRSVGRAGINSNKMDAGENATSMKPPPFLANPLKPTNKSGLAHAVPLLCLCSIKI